MSSLFEEYFRQRSDLVEADKKPIGVSFNNAGWMKAMKEEHDAGRDHNITHGPSATYCGLHRWIDPEQEAELVVTDKTQVQWFEDRRANRRRQNAISFAVKGSFGKLGTEEPKTMVEIVAQSLDAATLCDIIMHWLGADPHWGDFEKELHAVVEKHGRFE